MKVRLPFVFFVVLLAAALGLATACSKARFDAQVASDVQSKIGADQAVPSRQQVSVQAANGVVTLSGFVASDAERNAAAADAATVAGVKTVVNNLSLQQQPVQQSAQAQPPAREQQLAPAQTPTGESRHARPARTRDAKPSASIANQAEASNIPPVNPAAEVAVAPTPTPQPAPVVPSRVTIPEGTTIAVRLIDGVDSERNHPGDLFRGSLNTPIVVNENVAIPVDADVQGRVVDAQSAGRFAGAGKLAIELTKISYGGHSYQIQTSQWSKESTGRGKNTAEKVGGGALLGAIIGGLAGGGKGAAIGGTVGAGAGGGVQAATHGQQVKLAPEALVNFQLQSSISVTPAAGKERQAMHDE